MRHLFCLGLLGLFVCPVTRAQYNCPQGFNHVGTLSLTGSYGATEERREIQLPEGAIIDTTFQQTKVRSSSGNSKAKSNMQAADIPKGILIVPSGTTSLDKGWAVSGPELKKVESRYKFGMKLYCTTGGGAYDNMGGCDVEVEVCYKPKI